MLCVVAALARDASVALLLAVLTVPRVSFAQGTVDEAKIVECVRSVEKDTGPKMVDPDAATAKCAHLEEDHCMESATKEWAYSAAFGICLNSELSVWQKLLVQAYEAASTSQRERDRLTIEKYSAPEFEPVLPAFIEAHEKWQAFVTAECALAHVEASGGTYSRYGVSTAICAIGLTARRVFLYRARAKLNEGVNERVLRPK
jgi:uncharacterized protein YecT (DUF1311 family)